MTRVAGIAPGPWARIRGGGARVDGRGIEGTTGGAVSRPDIRLAGSIMVMIAIALVFDDDGPSSTPSSDAEKERELTDADKTQVRPRQPR